MASSVPSANQGLNFISQDEIHAPTKSYPSLWGDIFISNNLDTEVQVKYDESVAALREEVRSMVMGKESKTTEKIVLIDDIERLGLSYLFEKEIEEQLQQIFHQSSDSDFKAMENYDLFNTALLFRLFRQHGYNIPCGVFDKFKDKDNKFLAALKSDIRGLLSFYEATDVKFQGENVLEEGFTFAINHLNRLTSQMDSSIRDKVSRALEQSIHRGIPILEMRHYIPIYENQKSSNQLLGRLARLNFRYLQNLYQKELADLSRWWKDSNIHSKIPYIRDRVVECYFWGVAWNYEPQYSFARSAVANAMMFVTMLDDTYDTYAPLEDLDILTKVLQSDDIDEVDQVPAYIKEIHEFRSRLYEEFDTEASKYGRSFAVSYFKEAVKQISMAYHMDANWYRRKHFPAFEDVLSNSIITSAYFVLSTASFLIGTATEQELEWLMSKPKIVAASALVGRYYNDVASYDRESKINGGESLSAVDCYMKQYGVSKEETLNKFVELAEDSWMTVNKEWVEIVSVPRHSLKPVLNYSRAALTTYKNCKDGFTYPEKVLKPHILAILVDPI